MRLAAAVVCAGASLSAAAAFAEDQARPAGLAPYQMVRSLQLLQDRIAAGDHAALPMQRKLLELTDARLRAADPALFGERRNLRGLLIYAMSGGNPATVAHLVSKLSLSEADARLANAVVDYVAGRPARARDAFSGIDLAAVEAELGAFLGLVKGSLVALDEPAKALPHLDFARLLAPGTLVEEAALRRTIPIASTTGDRKRFLAASQNYVWRYLHSPYASQFAEAFVAGVVAFAASITTDEIDGVVAQMTPDQQRVVYLRIARFAAIDGRKELSAYASAKAMAMDGAGDDPRAALYSSMSSVTSGTVEDVLAELRAIDRTKLSASDRRLLEAAEAVAAGVLAAPASAPPVDAEMEELSPAGGERGVARPEETSTADRTANAGDAALPGTAAARPAAPSAVDAAATKIEDVRRRIDAIDAMLRETN